MAHAFASVCFPTVRAPVRAQTRTQKSGHMENLSTTQARVASLLVTKAQNHQSTCIQHKIHTTYVCVCITIPHIMLNIPAIHAQPYRQTAHKHSFGVKRRILTTPKHCTAAAMTTRAFRAESAHKLHCFDLVV